MTTTPTSVSERIVASFDQAAARGIPAANAVKGLSRKFRLRRPRVLEVLIEAGRVRTSADGGLCWSTSPAPMSARAVQEQTRLDLIQAAIDHGLALGVLEAQRIEHMPPAVLLRTVADRLASADAGAEAA